MNKQQRAKYRKCLINAAIEAGVNERLDSYQPRLYRGKRLAYENAIKLFDSFNKTRKPRKQKAKPVFAGPVTP